MSLYDYAERELDLIGLDESEDINGMMRRHILNMVRTFADEGHSGFSASYAIQCLEKLLRFEPLTPLTGEDWEWCEISRDLTGSNQGTLYQNARCSRVFKDDEGAYDVDGKVFWSWMTDEETGEQFKSYYTNRESRVPVTFPYTPVTVYEERISGSD